MRAEILFPEVCNLYGDLQNIYYLKRCCPALEIIETDLHSKPRFLTEDVALVYMGSTTEQGLRLAADALRPYAADIAARADAGQLILLTGNAPDVFSAAIESDSADTIEGLGILPGRVRYTMMKRHNSFFLGSFEDMDVVGFNYRTHLYTKAYHELPQQIMMGSETASTFSSRGTYHFPVERTVNKVRPDNQSSGYDLDCGSWSNLPEDDFVLHDDYDWCIGEFVWTGFDYLGEPTPYYTDWPSHSSLFGIIDLAGLPKDRYYLYRSHWNKDKETLHILPHWNWEGREGEVTPVFVYTNYPSAELFINGKSQGKRTKDLSVTVNNSGDSTSVANFKRQQRYRLMWMDTKYEPGTVKVVAYDKDGKAVAEKEIHTAGKPDHIELVADRSVIDANGKDLSFVTVKVVDKEGNLCPLADNEISFKVKGAGTYRAGANGNPASLESFQTPKMKVFSGMMTAIVQSTEKAGKITLEATGKGLKKGTLLIESK